MRTWLGPPLLFACGCATLAALPAPAPASGCGTVTSYPATSPVYRPGYSYDHVRKIYVSETLIVPFSVPYAFLTFNAAPTTPPPVLVAQDQLPTSTVPAAAPAPKPAPAAAPMPAAPPPAVAALDERLSRIERALALLTGTGLSGPPAQPQGPSGAGVETPPPVAVGEGEEPPPPPVAAAPQADTRATSYTPPAGGAHQGGTPGGAASLAAVAQLMQTRCASCHTSPGRDGVDLFDSTGAWRPNVSKAEILRSVRGDKMPRSPVKLSSSEKALVEAWAREQ